MAYSYPTTKRDSTADDFWGTRVADPYRWLEDTESSDTKAWVDAQNELTFAHLEQIEIRRRLRDRMEQLWDFPRWTAPTRRGERLFYTKNDGLQNQPVLFRLDGRDGRPVVLLDPNTLTDDGTAALIASAPSDAANSARRTAPSVYVDVQPIIAGVSRAWHSSTAARATA